MLILASRSPRRQALLKAAGLEFRVVVPLVEDTTPSCVRGSYSALARRSAVEKALSIGPRREIVLGADTIVVCEGEALGKPRGEADARRMLRKLSGKWHGVYTGVALVQGARRLIGYERTEVAFRELSKREIDWYVETGEPLDKAGAYAIQGAGAGLIRTLRGCYTNVIGLPLPKLLGMLAEFEAEGRAER
jgi:septum formation protein